MLRPISRFKLAVKVIGWHCLVFLCILSCFWPSFTILFFKFILFNHLATFRAYCITLILHILTLFFLLNPRPVEDMRDYVNNPLGSNLGQCTLHICLWLIAFACPLSCYLLAGKLTVCVSLCYLSLWGIVQPVMVRREALSSVLLAHMAGYLHMNAAFCFDALTLKNPPC